MRRARVGSARVDDHRDRLELGDRVRDRGPGGVALVAPASVSPSVSPSAGNAIQVRSCGAVSAGILQVIGSPSLIT